MSGSASRRVGLGLALLLPLLLLSASCGQGDRGASPPDDEPVSSAGSRGTTEEHAGPGPWEQVVYYATDRAPLEPGFGWYLQRFLWAAVVLLVGRIVLRSLRKIVAPPYQWRVTLGNWILGVAVVVLVVYAGWQCLRTTTLQRRLGLVYGGGRAYVKAADGLPLDLGMLTVSIPPSHRRGAVERPSLFKGDIFEDPQDHMVLTGTWRLKAEPFFEKIRTRCDGQHDIFVFVHGYNCTFEDAALRAAQIAWDTNFPGAPILYSWPSAGSIPEYLADGANVAWSVPHLYAFLTRLMKETQGTRIHLVAHSMGNRALTEALRRIRSDQRKEEDPYDPFREIVLAAPDVDADTFRDDLAPAIVAPKARISLYASSHDWALLVSQQFHGAPRAGEAGESLVVVPGIETVDVSAITGSHSYIGDNDRVLDDLMLLIEGEERPLRDLPPQIRQVRKPHGDLWYWVLEKLEDAREEKPDDAPAGS